MYLRFRSFYRYLKGGSLWSDDGVIPTPSPTPPDEPDQPDQPDQPDDPDQPDEPDDPTPPDEPDEPDEPEYEYVPTSEDGEGLYGLVDDEYVPLDATSTSVIDNYTYAYWHSTYVPLADYYPPYYFSDTTHDFERSEYTLAQITSLNLWLNGGGWYYLGGGNAPYRIDRFPHIVDEWTYTFDGITYYGQRYQRIEVEGE